MTIFTATQIRGRLFEVLKKTVRGHAPVQITTKNGNAVLVSQEDYEGLLETLKLLSMPGFRKSIRAARADIRAGRTKSMDEVFGK